MNRKNIQNEDSGSEDYPSEEEIDRGEEEEEIDTSILASIPLGKRVKLQKIGISKFDKRDLQAIKDKEAIMQQKKKDAPEERSSKKPVSRNKIVVHAPIKNKPRDPRFDELSGTYNKELFQKTYSFIPQLQQKELGVLKQEIAREGDADRREKIEKEYLKMQSQIKQRAVLAKKEERLREWKRNEKKLVAEGSKNPYYLKKSDQKRITLIDDYNELKQDPQKLERFIAKRRERKAKKDHKFLPYQRNQKS